MLSFESQVRTRWHPVPVAWKFLSVCIASVLLFVFDALWVQCAALLLCCLLYLIGGGVRFFCEGFQRLKFLWVFILIILLWHAFSGTSEQGFVVVLRLVTLFALSNIMTMTSRLSDMLAMINRTLAPIRALGIRTRPLELAIALVVRFTPVLIKKGVLLVEAWRVRTVKRPGWRLIFPLSLVAIDDAEHIAEALKARGGTGKLK